MKRKTTEPDDYEVGYGKPPKANRFRKGRSGNPRGRRRGDENLIAVFKRLAGQRVAVIEDGKRRTMERAELIILKNINAALQKDAAAMSNVARLFEEAGELIDRTDVKQVGRPIAVPRRAANMEEFLAQYGRSVDTE